MRFTDAMHAYKYYMTSSGHQRFVLLLELGADSSELRSQRSSNDLALHQIQVDSSRVRINYEQSHNQPEARDSQQTRHNRGSIITKKYLYGNHTFEIPWRETRIAKSNATSASNGQTGASNEKEIVLDDSQKGVVSAKKQISKLTNADRYKVVVTKLTSSVNSSGIHQETGGEPGVVPVAVRSQRAFGLIA